MAPVSRRARMVRAARVLGRVVRGLLAAVLLAALIAGLPWALVYGVGWPLPDHLPSVDEIGAVLMAPMSSQFLLNVLACLAWLLWALFVLDIAACVVQVARGAHWPELRQHNGPLRRVVAALIGTLLAAMLSRTATAAPAGPVPTARPAGHPPVAVTAPAWPASAPHAHAAADAETASPADPGTERVRAPVDGVHDSLWRIAQRCLGDGDRWPELWHLNQGSTQPGGRVLSNPNLIHPGDILRLPGNPATSTQTAPPPPREAQAPPPHEAPTPRTTPPASPPPSTSQPAPQAPTTSAVPTPQRAPTPPPPPAAGTASPWGGEVFVSLGLATAVSALLLLARRRHHARYRPGSRRRYDDAPAAPVVYQLRLAHLRAQHHDEDTALAAEEENTEPPEPRQPLPATAPRTHSTPPHGHESRLRTTDARRVIGAAPNPATPPSIVDIAIHQTDQSARSIGPTAAGDATQLALDLARVHGLGLIGPGGYAAARALLLTTLTTTAAEDISSPPPLAVVVPAADLTRLLGVATPLVELPDAVTVVPDVASALATLEPDHAELPASRQQRALLVASAPSEPDLRERLQQLLEDGPPAGITALLLGQWRTGVTAYVTGDGVISATDPGLGEPLRGTRAFTLPDTATRDLLAFLRTVQTPEPAPTTDAAEPVAAGAPQTRVPPRAGPVAGERDNAPEPSDPNEPWAEGRRLEITIGAPTAESSESSPSESSASESSQSEADEHSGAQPGASSATASPSGAPCPLVLSAFGAPALHWRPAPNRPDDVRDLSGELSTRPIELLVFLAAHPGGVSRDAVIDALWPDHPPRNPASVLRTVLSRIRHALQAATRGSLGELVLAEHGRYQLDPTVVEVDYWAFADAVTRRRTATTTEARTAAYEAIVARYGGQLADGLDAEWLVAAREATRRDALDAVAALARARVDTDPHYTLDLLETARAFDPHNELLYRDIMRLQHALGRHDAISRTLALLETRLTEIDATPTADIVDLARRLRARHTGIPVETPPDTPLHE